MTTVTQPDRTNILVVLQNAWYKDPESVAKALKRHGYAFYVRTLRRTYSGSQLFIVFDDWSPEKVRFINTTKKLVDHPSKKEEPDPLYVTRKLNELEPDTMILMGDQAHSLYEKVPLPQNVLLLPHPAHRLCSREFWTAARQLLLKIRCHPGIARVRMRPTRKGPVTEYLKQPGED